MLFVIILCIINIISFVLIVKTLMSVQELNTKIIHYVFDDKNQKHNEFDLQQRLENFQKMKFSISTKNVK